MMWWSRLKQWFDQRLCKKVADLPFEKPELRPRVELYVPEEDTRPKLKTVYPRVTWVPQSSAKAAVIRKEQPVTTGSALRRQDTQTGVHDFGSTSLYDSGISSSSSDSGCGSSSDSGSSSCD